MAPRKEIFFGQHVFRVQSANDFVSRFPSLFGVDVDYHILRVSQLVSLLEANFQAGRTCQRSPVRCPIPLVSSDKLLATLERRNPHRRCELTHLAIDPDSNALAFFQSEVSQPAQLVSQVVVIRCDRSAFARVEKFRCMKAENLRVAKIADHLLAMGAAKRVGRIEE
jgi:hypothetical protein